MSAISTGPPPFAGWCQQVHTGSRRRDCSIGKSSGHPELTAPAQRRLATAHRRGGLRHALFHLLGRDVLGVRRDAPTVAERILDGARPVAVELVLDLLHDLGTVFGR